jgi:hypothetical protein
MHENVLVRPHKRGAALSQIRGLAVPADNNEGRIVNGRSAYRTAFAVRHPFLEASPAKHVAARAADGVRERVAAEGTGPVIRASDRILGHEGNDRLWERSRLHRFGKRFKFSRVGKRTCFSEGMP